MKEKKLANANQGKSIRVTLSPADASFISEVAEALGISETDVLRKGLKMMGVYKEAKEDNSRLMLENKDDKTIRELMVL